MNKKIIITGATDGLGKAIAKELKDQELILIGRNENKLKEVSAELNCKYYVCDLRDYKQIETVISNIDKVDVSVSDTESETITVTQQMEIVLETENKSETENIFATEAVPETETMSEVNTEAETEVCKTNGFIIAIDAGHQKKGNSEKEPVGPGTTEMKARFRVERPVVSVVCVSMN